MNLNTEHPTGDELNAVSDGLLELSDATLETLSGGNDGNMGGYQQADQELFGKPGFGEITVNCHGECNFTFVSPGPEVATTDLPDMNGRRGAADPPASFGVLMTDAKKIGKTAPLTQDTGETSRSTF